MPGRRTPSLSRRLALALGLLTFASSACSSVTRLDATRAASTGKSGAAGAGDLVTDDTLASGDTLGAGTTGAAGSAAQRTAATARSAANNATSGAACNTPYKVGASYSSDLAAGLAAVGHPEAAATYSNYASNLKRSYQLAVDDLNKRGGVNGCRVVLFFHDFSSLAADGFDGQSQKECTDFTQDQPVSIVYANALENRVLVECLHQHGVAVRMSYFSPDQPDYETYRGTLFQPDSLSVSRYGPLIGMFAGAGYFDKVDPVKPVKVGILVGDDGTGSRPRMVDKIWKPQLRARGLDPVIFEYKLINGYNDVSRVTTAFGQAVLQFSGQNVTHVLIPPDQSNAVIFFTQAAESQGYRPRYGVTTESGAASWFSAPSAQRTNAVAVSYKVSDIQTQAVRDQNKKTAVWARCEAMYNAQNLIVDYPWCDFVQFLQDAFVKERPSHAALLRGAEAIGSAHQSAVGYGATLFGPHRYDGLGAARAMKWDVNTNEWAYTPGITAIP